MTRKLTHKIEMPLLSLALAAVAAGAMLAGLLSFCCVVR